LHQKKVVMLINLISFQSGCNLEQWVSLPKIPVMSVEDRIAAFAKLGERIGHLSDDEREDLYRRAEAQNRWFTHREIAAAFDAWQDLLTEEKLQAWLQGYHLGEMPNPKSIGIMMAGNIPAVGFHDLMAVLLVGHKAYVKLSSSDAVLMGWIIRNLQEIEPRFSITIEELLRAKDAYVATGSDNSARYFEYYFGRYPSIIRKNRTSVAILNGDENESDLQALGRDIFQYYGLGCRNVSKLYVNDTDNILRLLDAVEKYKYVADNHKYFNNYEYNKSIYLVNREPHLDNGFLLVRESEGLVSPISVVYYEIYSDEHALKNRLSEVSDKIQCILSKDAWYPKSLPFGEAQCPALDDYADGVDTISFLRSLD
jgi:hypothetical protein